MPRGIKNAAARKVVLQMTIEIVVSFCKAYFDGKRPGESVNDMLICAALVVGQLESRPLNASKLADYVGTARSTVIRRLASLEKRGFVMRSGMNFTLRPEVANSEPVLAAGVAARTLVKAAAIKLSNLDSKEIAKRPPLKL